MANIVPVDELKNHPEIKQHSTALDDIYIELAELEVTDDASEVTAIELIGRAKGIFDKAEATRLALVKPIKDHAKAIDTLIRETFKKPYEEIRAEIESKIAPFRQKKKEEMAKKEQRVAEENVKRQAEANKETAEQQSELNKMAEELGLDEAPQAEVKAVLPEIVTDEVKNTVHTDTGSSATFRKKWKYRVIDPAKVPLQYLAEDPTDKMLVNKAIKDGVRTIEGLEIYEDEILAVSGVN